MYDSSIQEKSIQLHYSRHDETELIEFKMWRSWTNVVVVVAIYTVEMKWMIDFLTMNNMQWMNNVPTDAENLVACFQCTLNSKNQRFLEVEHLIRECNLRSMIKAAKHNDQNTGSILTELDDFIRQGRNLKCHATAWCV